MDECSPKKIAINSAQSAIEQATAALTTAKADYYSCVGPQEAGQAALADASDEIAEVQKQVNTLQTIQTFVLRQMQREVDATETAEVLKESAAEEEERLRREIEAVKAEIRMEKRRFLDANPSATTAVAGVYFTQQPDNQLLIAFLTCLVAFLLFVGILVILNKFPGLSTLLGNTTMWERIKIVGGFWVLALLITYIYLFTFT